MSGVEAAASLFGPEDSALDPFTTLGTDNTSMNPFDDDLFIGASSECNHSTFSTDGTTYSEYSAKFQQNLGNGHDLYSHSQSSAVNSSTSWGQSTESHTSTSSEIHPFILGFLTQSISQTNHQHYCRNWTTRIHTDLRNTSLQ